MVQVFFSAGKENTVWPLVITKMNTLHVTDLVDVAAIMVSAQRMPRKSKGTDDSPKKAKKVLFSIRGFEKQQQQQQQQQQASESKGENGHASPSPPSSSSSSSAEDEEEEGGYSDSDTEEDVPSVAEAVRWSELGQKTVVYTSDGERGTRAREICIDLKPSRSSGLRTPYIVLLSFLLDDESFTSITFPLKTASANDMNRGEMRMLRRESSFHSWVWNKSGSTWKLHSDPVCRKRGRYEEDQDDADHGTYTAAPTASDGIRIKFQRISPSAEHIVPSTAP